MMRSLYRRKTILAMILTISLLITPGLQGSLDLMAASQEQQSTSSPQTAPGDVPFQRLLASGKQNRLLTCDFYVKAEFDRAISLAKPYELSPGILKAGVIPHHLLAAPLIASFLEASAQQGDFDTVIIIGPSHYPTANKVITSYCGWQTPFGTVLNDSEIVERLVSNIGISAVADDDNMQLDHAATGLVPFIKYYLPDVKIAACLLSNKLEKEREEELAKELFRLSREKNILLLCSVDFSHTLMPIEAAEHDLQTINAVKNFDYATLSSFSDTNIDSPQSIKILLRFLEQLGISKITLLDHSSSDRILKTSLTDPLFYGGTTTYQIYCAMAQS